MSDFLLFAHVRPWGWKQFEAVVTALPGANAGNLPSDRRAEVHDCIGSAETARDVMLGEMRGAIFGRGDRVLSETISRCTLPTRAVDAAPPLEC